jgi:uncharacterized protein YndB with AHSA1/START domain
MSEIAAPAPTPIEQRELILTRVFNVPRAKVYRCWTEPELLKKWFAPLPWTTTKVEFDLRPGGSSLFVMRSPEGHEFPNPGLFLEVVKNEKLAFTDAFVKAWQPSEKAFMVATITFEDHNGGSGTKYTARVQHWSVADREAHEKMGFHEGWGQCADQLAALAATL